MATRKATDLANADRVAVVTREIVNREVVAVEIVTVGFISFGFRQVRGRRLRRARENRPGEHKRKPPRKTDNVVRAANIARWRHSERPRNGIRQNHPAFA